MPPALTSPFSTGEFPELETLQRLVDRAGAAARADTLAEIETPRGRLPLICLELGSEAPDAPAVGFFGGVHGVERIGSQVLLAYLHALVERLGWDESLAAMLARVRLVFVPIVNPGGMLLGTRANPAGVDLMRNAPVEADPGVPRLLGGQRLSPSLPWYRGGAGEPMQPEAQALCALVERRLLGQPFSLTLDCHSGFGMRDRIWFPYARTREPVACLPEIYALRSMFRSTHPFHGIYVIEPQSRQYLAHGDLWDYLYDRSDKAARTYIPLTLELGSWIWVKKRPLQLFSTLGLFNPIAPHRLHRALRRHLTLLDFLVRAAISHHRWRPPAEARAALMEAAMAYWYGAARPAPQRLA
ncbi:MAG TPA: M14 family zinc carboxypeptidase [Nevskiales bacterium]|nr:M14 family zinc carboxypeptidase [Nevskiales bacterium]